VLALPQGGLFDTPDNGALGGQGSAVSERTGPGRPAGSRNRATEDRRRFYLSRHSDPLEGAIVFALPADLLEGARRALALAKLLKCKPLEALDFMRKAGADAMPYLHARAVDVTLNGKVAHAHIGLGAPPKAGADTSGGMAQLREFLDAGLDELAPDERAVIELVAAEIRETETQDKTDA
jgi:hypothetical protein